MAQLPSGRHVVVQATPLFELMNTSLVKRRLFIDEVTPLAPHDVRDIPFCALFQDDSSMEAP